MCIISSSILALTTVNWPHIPTVKVSHLRLVSNCEAIRVRDFRLPLRYRSGRRSSGTPQLILLVAYRRFWTAYWSLLQVSRAFGRLDLKMGPSVNNINTPHVITHKNKGLAKWISSLHRAFREITSTINQQMHLYNFHLKHLKPLRHISIISGQHQRVSFFLAKFITYSRFSSFL